MNNQQSPLLTHLQIKSTLSAATFKYDQIFDIPISAMIWFEHSLQQKNIQKRSKTYEALRQVT
jgi:hypothetical protein